jgi:hypothetical protein
MRLRLIDYDEACLIDGFALRRDRDGVGFASVIARTGRTRRTLPALAGAGACAREIGFLRE